MSAGDAAPQAAAQGEGEGQGQAQQQGPDVAALAEQLGPLSQNMEAMRSLLESEPWKAQEPAAEEPQEEPLNLDFLETGDPQFDQQLAQNLQQIIDARTQQQVQQAMQQFEQKLEPLMDKMTGYDAQALVDEFPELEEEQTANRVMQFSRQRAEVLGMSPDQATRNMDFVRESYLLGRAMQAMQEEQQAGQESAAHLEGAGGAGAGGASQVDLGDQIVNGPDGQRLGSRVLPFH